MMNLGYICHMISKELEIAAECIKLGKTVALPTETVYGLGANALDPMAVARIFEIKERPFFDPLIVHIESTRQWDLLTTLPLEKVQGLIDAFWPGPLTMVVPKTDKVPDIVTAGLPNVGIRMPNHPMALALIRLSGCPIAAPSANKFGRISPTTAEHVRKNLSEADYILDGGPTTVGIESTIIQILPDGFQLLRKGIITAEQIEQHMPMSKTPIAASEKVAPGMLDAHYAPHKKMFLTDFTTPPSIDIHQAGLISFSGKNTESYKKVIRVSEHNDLKEYAVHLFAAMHDMDQSDIQFIVAESVPETGIGGAIMDRLKKAVFRFNS